MNKEHITFEEFLELEKKLDIRIGQVIVSERIPKSKKLLKLTVIFGETENDVRIVVTNLGDRFEPEAFLMVKMPFIMNLTPSTMMGVQSQAMIMVGENSDGVINLHDYNVGAKLM